ncbi:MAG: hypothetical protein ACLQSR_07510 [Limisphaerales bacterium]
MNTPPTPALNPFDRKPRRSILDPYAKVLLKMHDKHDKLVQMQKWLWEKKKLKISLMSISRFLKRLRQPRGEAQILSNISKACQECQTVRAAFRENPPPDIKTVIQVTQTLIWRIYTQKNPDGAALALADKLVKTAIHYADARTRNAFKARQVKIAVEKAGMYKKNEQALALEFCLDECKDYPKALELFKSAFDALDADKTSVETTNDQESLNAN